MINVNKLSKFLYDAYSDLYNGGYGTWHIDLDTDEYPLEVGVGCLKDGDDEYICAKICVFDDLPDYAWATMPYDSKTGDVWDSEMVLDYRPNYDSEAKWLIREAKDIVKELDAGKLTY